MGKERFTSILRTHESQLHVVAIRKLIAEPVAVRISQIAFFIALTLIKRYTHSCG